MLSGARLEPYLTAASGDIERAADLYLWINEVSGALHSQLAFVELAVRNAVDPPLRAWNFAQGFGEDWTAQGQTADPLYRLVGKGLTDARTRAAKEARLRRADHPRYASPVNHDDIVAQLMFGSWVAIIHPVSGSPAAQRQLWQASTGAAFPFAKPGEQGRHGLGRQLDALRRLRNRVAHHDNLLAVNITHRQNGMLSVLAQIDPELASLAAGRSALRRLAREDPRKRW